jgi:hypothetical protein
MAGIVLSACGGSTAPSITGTQHMAAAMDTLAVAAASAEQFDRFRLLAYPIAAMSQNVTPASVSLMVDGAAQTYQALAVEVVGTTAGPKSSVVPSDSFMVVVAWTGTNVDELVYMQVLQPDALFDFADLSDTVANFNLDSVTVLNAAISSATGGCKSYSLPELNAAVTSLLQGSTCNSGSSNVAFSFFYAPNPPQNPHTSFVLAAQPLPTVRLILPPGTGGQNRLRQLLSRSGWRRAP